MHSPLDTLLSVDFSIVSHLNAWAVSSPLAEALVWVCAQLVIVIPFTILLLLWQNPDKYSRRKPIRKTVVMALVSITVALAIKSLISFLVARDRPYVSHPGLDTLGIYVDSASFPSGHTILAFTVAFSVWRSGLSRTGTVLTAIAFLVALGRIAAGVHYPTDILGGIAIAGFSVWYVHRESGSLKQYLPDR